MGQLLVILILLAVQVLMFLYFRLQIRRELSRENRIDSVRREIEQLIIELDHTTDRNVEILENRISSLKEAVSQGERVIRLIESEQEKRDNAVPLYTDLRNNQLPSSEDKEVLFQVVNEEESALSDVSLDIEVIDGRERALEMFKQGMDASLIASSTGLPRGEVDLIISLNKKG
jgi:septal ring factor EnvC (AmiA/AmiB activator)